jgi:exodeoxyribonuclease VII small subunit
VNAQPVKKRSPPNFESDLAELELLVARMERGDLSLEEAIGTFERGVALARSCQQALRDAEQKVQRLSQNASGESLEPLPPPSTPGNDDEEAPDEDEL